MKNRKTKKEIISNKTADRLIVALFFIAGMFSLNILESSIVINILGIAFIIAGVFGLVLILKGKKFLF